MIRYIYRDRHGKQAGYVERVDTPNGKQFRPYLKSDGSCGAPNALRTLYNRDGIEKASGEYVCIPEGEKCVDALIKLGVVATTSSGGSGSVLATDWKPLNKFKKVYLFEDNDEAGQKYVDQVAVQIKYNNPDAQIHVVRFPDKEKGFDIADFIQGVEDEK